MKKVKLREVKSFAQVNKASKFKTLGILTSEVTLLMTSVSWLPLYCVPMWEKHRAIYSSHSQVKPAFPVN